MNFSFLLSYQSPCLAESLPLSKALNTFLLKSHLNPSLLKPILFAFPAYTWTLAAPVSDLLIKTWKTRLFPRALFPYCLFSTVQDFLSLCLPSALICHLSHCNLSNATYGKPGARGRVKLQGSGSFSGQGKQKLLNSAAPMLEPWVAAPCQGGQARSQQARVTAGTWLCAEHPLLSVLAFSSCWTGSLISKGKKITHHFILTPK